MADLVRHGLLDFLISADKRVAIGAAFGYRIWKWQTVLYRLNHYGISRDEYEQAVSRC